VGKTPFIRYSLAGFLLVLFAFSITPKKTLHDIITHHTDQKAVDAYAGTDQLHKAGFNCKCETLVAESPFTSTDNSYEFSCSTQYVAQHIALHHHYHYSAHFFFTLRGPPVAG